VAKSDRDRYREAVHYASQARQLLNYHAVLARASERRIMELLGIRDAMMADNLVYAAGREVGRGKLLAFAHNRHLQRGKVEWQLGPHLVIWWPAGSHLHEILGARYAVIGTGIGVSQGSGIGQPEAGTLEALLTTQPEAGILIPTHQGQSVPPAEIASLAVRSGSLKKPMYAPLGPESVSDFDWVAVLKSTT